MSHLKSFFRGMLSVFDPGVTFTDMSDYPDIPPIPEIPRPLSDAEAMAADWWSVGNDLRVAMGQPPVTLKSSDGRVLVSAENHLFPGTMTYGQPPSPKS
jgi:hypothetical protein